MLNEGGYPLIEEELLTLIASYKVDFGYGTNYIMMPALEKNGGVFDV